MKFNVFFGRSSFEEDFEEYLKLEDLNNDEVYVFFSPEYLSNKSEILDSYDNVFKLVESSTNIFPPEWRQSSTEYSCLRWLMYSSDVEVNYFTFSEEIYDDMDYYTHTHDFKNKRKFLIRDDGLEEEQLTTRIYDDDIQRMGKLYKNLFKAAGYDKMKNGPVPGFILQTGSSWLTRVLDIYRIRTKISREAVRFTDYDDLDKITENLNNPVYYCEADDAYIPRDLRMSLSEYSSTRKHLFDLTDKLLVK